MCLQKCDTYGAGVRVACMMKYGRNLPVRKEAADLHAKRQATALGSCHLRASDRTYRLMAIRGWAEDALQLAEQQVDLLPLIVFDSRQQRIPSDQQSVVVIRENG